MNVSDISAGSNVKIHASINNHKLVLMTTSILGVSAGLLVKPMEYFGKYMQFLEPSKIEIKNKRDGRIYKFMSSSITPVRTRYGNFHLIRCSSELTPENSRRSERFFIAKLGVFSVNGNTNSIKNCIVHDISMRGMSLVIDNTTRCKIGDRVDVSFRYGEYIHSYQVNAVVVRFFNVSGKPALGCSISNMNVDLIGLLNAKKAEKYSADLEANEAQPINPAISEKQQRKDLEEDLAKLLPTRKTTTAKAPTVKPDIIELTISKDAMKKNNAPMPKSSQVSGAKAASGKISGTNPLDPSKLEHVKLPEKEKTLREKKKEQRKAAEARAVEELLDLKDL